MDGRFVRCPDREPRRQFVHRITEAECARRRGAGFHKCPGCLRFTGRRAPVRFQGLSVGRLPA